MVCAANRSGANASRRLAVLAGALLLWAGLTAAAAALSRGLALTARHPQAATLDDLLAVVALAAAWLLLSWLALGVVISALASGPRALGGVLDRAADVLTPALLRRLVGALVGGAVLVGPALGAQAAAAASHDLGAREGARVSVAAGPGHEDPRAGAGLVVFDRPQVGGADPVVVRTGDALWTIAARALGASGAAPSPAEIAAEWPRWYAANRLVIGDDPDLLRPGQVLQRPAPPSTRATPSR